MAFLGPNGAGKSTTMKLLTGYVAPSEGIARIAGHDMATDRMAGSERLGYLPENGPLYPDMTPHSLLEFFADARGMSREQRHRRGSKRSSICACWAACFTSRSPSCPRGIASDWAWLRSLLHEPDVLILDEPTAGLDPNQIREVRRTMERLRDDEKKTILLSTHILQEVEAMASRVILINEGRLVYDGPVADLIHGQKGRLGRGVQAVDRGGSRSGSSGGRGTPRPSSWSLI